MVDDGVKSRGHRKNLFNESFNVCGIGASKHSKYEFCVTIDYAGGFD